MIVQTPPSRFVAPPLHPAIVELGGHPQWVAWRWAKRDGHLTKPLISPRTGRGASHSRAEDWTDFERAVSFAASQGMAGVGFVLTEADEFTGIDLDKCRDPETGEIELWAADVLALAETYAEISPSGRGLRMICRGKIPATVKCDPAHVEIYRSKRYLTITGEHLKGTPTEIRPAPETLRLLLERVEAFKSSDGALCIRENDDGTAIDLETGECFDSLDEAKSSLRKVPGQALPQVPNFRSGDDFFSTVNTRALASLGSWVPSLFPSARPQPGTGAYRVSSRDLGRDLQEDLSIAPNGIVDFGVADMGDARQGKRSAIDLCMEYGRGSDASDAALWLCERLRIEPSSIGWRSAGDEETIAIGMAAAARMAANGNVGQQSSTSAALLPYVRASDFAGLPKPNREFLDERCLIPMRNVTLLYGDGSTGKSLLAIQLGAAVSATGNWLGARTRRGPVFYVSAEDEKDETHARLAEISEADGFDLTDADDLCISLMAGLDCIMAVENGRSKSLSWTPIFEALRSRLAEVRPILLVIDNLADVFGADENVKTFARQFVSALRGLAIEFGCAVVMLAHPSQSGMASGKGTSGNVGWSNSARSRLYLYREVDETGHEADVDRRTLESMKLNYGRRGTTIAMTWQSGRFLCLDAPAPTLADPFAGVAKAMRAERVSMDLLRWHLRKDKFVSPNRSVSFAPTVFAAHPHAEGVKKREFEAAMNALLDRDEIMIFTHGSPAARRQHIGLPIGTTPYEEAAE